MPHCVLEQDWSRRRHHHLHISRRQPCRLLPPPRTPAYPPQTTPWPHQAATSRRTCGTAPLPPLPPHPLWHPSEPTTRPRPQITTQAQEGSRVDYGLAMGTTGQTGEEITTIRRPQTHNTHNPRQEFPRRHCMSSATALRARSSCLTRARRASAPSKAQVQRYLPSLCRRVTIH